MKLIDGIQRRTIKLVCSVKDFHYEEKLRLLGIMRLDTRRRRSDLIEILRLLNGNCSVNSIFFFATDVGGSMEPSF